MMRQKQNSSNQRGSTRYRFVTALRYRAFRLAAITSSGSGRTIDMSAGGMRIDIGRSLETGAEVELVLDWPGLYHDRQRMRLFVWGQVVRRGGDGTALRILSHEFRDAAAAGAAA